MKIKRASRKKSSFLVSFVTAILVIGGLYLLILCLAPKLPPIPLIAPAPAPVNFTAVKDDRIYIPKIGVNKEFLSGDEKVLDLHVWHRFPERGDPVKGGNFILAAHRFQFGMSPGEVRSRSPFYNLDQVQPGDSIYIDFQGKRYKYEAVKRYTIKADETYIEDPSPNTPKLTIYSCTLSDPHHNREVVEAKLVQANFDVHIRF